MALIRIEYDRETMEQEGELIISVCESSYQCAVVFVLRGQTEPLRSPEVLWYIRGMLWFAAGLGTGIDVTSAHGIVPYIACLFRGW